MYSCIHHIYTHCYVFVIWVRPPSTDVRAEAVIIEQNAIQPNAGTAHTLSVLQIPIYGNNNCCTVVYDWFEVPFQQQASIELIY